ncbi:hypothetical protein [Sinisalibacter lacisalsi]|nr:hypothetical protein [Sinisalibacter lacisalsi]
MRIVFAAACGALFVFPSGSDAQQSVNCRSLTSKLIAANTEITKETFDLVGLIVWDLAEKAGEEDPEMFAEILKSLFDEMTHRQMLETVFAVTEYCE